MERGEADGDKQEVAWKEKKKSKQKMKEQYGVKCEYEIPWKDHEEGKKKCDLEKLKGKEKENL